MNYTKEQLEHLRREYPVGTRLMVVEMAKCWSPVEPFAPVPSGTVGSVDHIDDMGHIHMNWDMGESLALIPAVDQFKRIEVKKYCTPVNVMYRASRDRDYDLLPNYMASEYQEKIAQAIRACLLDYQMPNIHTRGLAVFLDNPLEQKVYSMVPSVAILNGKLMGTITCEFRELLTEEDQDMLFEVMWGHFSDGWGEVFAQQNISVHDGEIQVFFWDKFKNNTIKEY